MSRRNSKENSTEITEKISVPSTTDNLEHNTEEKVKDLKEDLEKCSLSSEELFDSTMAKESAIVQPDLVFPQFPDYSSEAARLQSFEGWPVQTPKPEDLAAAGLFYTGISDETLCFYCGGGLKDWEEKDDPWNEHELWFSECDFIRHKAQ